MKKLIIVLFLLFAIQVNATTYYCDPCDGNSATGDGSEGNPWGTLESAVLALKFRYPFSEGKVQSGDTVKLLGGFHGSPSISNSNGRYTAYVIIEPNEEDFVTMNNFKLRYASYIHLKGVTISPSILPGEIEDFYPFAGTKGIFDSRYSDHLIIEDCNIFTTTDDVALAWNAYEWAYWTRNGIGASGDGLVSSIIRNNTIRNVGFGIFSQDPNCLVENNTIDNFCFDAFKLQGPNSIIQDNVVRNHYKDAKSGDIHSDFIQGNSNGVDVIIRRNYFCGNTDPNRDPNTLGGIQGIFLEFDLTNGLIENNVVITMNNNWGITMWRAIDSNIMNNTVIRAYGTGTIAPITVEESGSSNAVFRNNLATYGGQPGSFPSGEGITADHNFDLNEYVYSEQFVDWTTGDLQLLAGSDFVDAGSAENAPITDILGNTRDASPDIGAYEFLNGDAAPATFFRKVWHNLFHN